jgi:hypothetical protein
MPFPNYFFWFRHRLSNAHYKAHTHVYPGVTITRFKFNCFKNGLIVQLIHTKPSLGLNTVLAPKFHNYAILASQVSIVQI